VNRADDPAYRDVRSALTIRLLGDLHGSDEEFVRDGLPVGLPEGEYEYHVRPGLFGQRGGHWPPPPVTGIGVPL
jgi:hypothetical protein